MAGFVRFLHTIKPQVLIGYKGSIFDRFIVFSGYYYQGCHDRKVAPPKHTPLSGMSILWDWASTGNLALPFLDRAFSSK